MSLEQSPEYKSKLEAVRKMPQSFGKRDETQKEEFARWRLDSDKRDAASNLRQEVLLDNAKCARVMVRALEDNPKLTVEEMLDLVSKQANVIHPEIVTAFAKELADTRDRVAKAVKDLKQESDTKKQGMAKLLYRRLIPDMLKNPKKGQPKLPVGEVKLAGTYPLAVQLDVMDDRDFMTFHTDQIARSPRDKFAKHTQAAYQAVPEKDSLDEMFRQLGGNYVDFPVIVVRPGSVGNDIMESRRHEQGHAENKALEETLKTQKRKFVWGEPEWKSGVSNDYLEKLWDQDSDKARQSVYWKQIQERAASAAKDELLADINAGEGKFLDSKSLNRLQYRESYSYFEDLGIDPKSDLHQALWQEYQQTLEKAAGRVTSVIKACSLYNLQERVELVRWVAAQTPLTRWNRQFVDANFNWEAFRLFQLTRFCSAAIHGDDEAEKQRRMDLIKQMTEELQQNQDKPLTPILDRYEKEFRMPEDFA